MKASDNPFPGILIRESANDGSDFSNPAADYRIVFLGEDGEWHSRDSAGGVAGMGGAVTAVGNLWAMTNTSSVTLTNNTLTLITFNTAWIDGGGSVIDLANDRFVAPATGFYLAIVNWIWEATAPAATANCEVRVGGTAAAPLIRVEGTPLGQGSIQGTVPLSLTSGDFVTLYINPAAVTGVTFRGNASPQIRGAFTLVRIT